MRTNLLFLVLNICILSISVNFYSLSTRIVTRSLGKVDVASSSTCKKLPLGRDMGDQRPTKKYKYTTSSASPGPSTKSDFEPEPLDKLHEGKLDPKVLGITAEVEPRTKKKNTMEENKPIQRSPIERQTLETFTKNLSRFKTFTFSLSQVGLKKRNKRYFRKRFRLLQQSIANLFTAKFDSLSEGGYAIASDDGRIILNGETNHLVMEELEFLWMSNFSAMGKYMDSLARRGKLKSSGHILEEWDDLMLHFLADLNNYDIVSHRALRRHISDCNQGKLVMLHTLRKFPELTGVYAAYLNFNLRHSLTTSDSTRELHGLLEYGIDEKQWKHIETHYLWFQFVAFISIENPKTDVNSLFTEFFDCMLHPEDLKPEENEVDLFLMAVLKQFLLPYHLVGPAMDASLVLIRSKVLYNMLSVFMRHYAHEISHRDWGDRKFLLHIQHFEAAMGLISTILNSAWVRYRELTRVRSSISWDEKQSLSLLLEQCEQRFTGVLLTENQRKDEIPSQYLFLKMDPSFQINVNVKKCNEIRSKLASNLPKLFNVNAQAIEKSIEQVLEAHKIFWTLREKLEHESKFMHPQQYAAQLNYVEWLVRLAFREIKNFEAKAQE